MTLLALTIATVIASATSAAFGFWWRGRIDRANASTSTPANTDDGVLALVDIQIFGDVVRTEMRINRPRLEQISHGLGVTLLPLPSTARH